MVTDEGRVKILDFGLAKLLATGRAGDGEDTEPLTLPGLIMGSVPYMSPEQVYGKPVDHRSDLFSLGILLYQMAVGEAPFHAAGFAKVVLAILHDQPSSVNERRPELPSHLGQIIRHCLEKDPQRRYQSALDVSKDLAGLAKKIESERILRSGALQSAPSDTGRRLAVLPLDDLSGDPRQAFFADGMTEALITDLAKISALRVISRTSVMRSPGISTLLGGTPKEAADQMRKTFPRSRKWSGVAIVGTSTAAAVRQAGFEIVPDPTGRFPNHARLFHPEGIAGFTAAHLKILAKTFIDTTGC